MIQLVTESDLREMIEAVHSLSHFHDIRQVVQVEDLVEVRGCVALDDVPGNRWTDAAPLAVGGFVYCVESYDLTAETPEFVKLAFSCDPWLI